MKTFLILAVLIVGALSNPITDTLNFNKLWFSDNNIRNQVKLTWTRANQNLDFHLSFPDYDAGIQNIVDVVFLRREKGGTTYITQFNPVRSVSGGKVHHKESVKIFDIDSKNGNYKDCERASSGPEQETQTCHGFLAYIHQIDSGNRDKRFKSGLDLAMARWEFRLQVVYNLKVSDDVNLKVKTKVEALPCKNCKCDDDCELDVKFQLDHKLCNSGDPNDCSRTDNVYTFADWAYFFFFLDVKTRKLTPHQIHATSEKDGVGAQIPLSYIEKVWHSKAGEILVQFPIAGPASEAGLKFDLKWTFRLESLARRFLEDATDRVLESPKAKVAVTDIKGIDASAPPKKLNLAEQINANNNAELQKVYNLCAAIIGVIALTCVCATVSNILPMFRKKSYADIPIEQAKA